MVESFTGERFSMVAYTPNENRPVRPHVVSALSTLSLPMPPPLVGQREGRYGLYYTQAESHVSRHRSCDQPRSSRQTTLQQFWKNSE